MKRYIDANNIKMIADLHGFDDEDNILISFSDVARAIAQTPTEDVMPVIHAHWISQDFFAERVPYKCSNCNRGEHWKERYCPNCGARMDEETEQ